MSFTTENEQDNKIWFADVNLFESRVNLRVYWKPTFSGVYKIIMIYILVNRCFRICANWSMFLSQLTLLKEIFQKNGYPENAIDRCITLFLNRIRIPIEKAPTITKKPLRLVLPYLGTLSPQTRAKFQKSVKAVFNCCKLQVGFKS